MTAFHTLGPRLLAQSKVTISEVTGTSLLAILVAKRAASLGHFYNWLFISPKILSVFMLLVTKQKLIFHQLGRVSFLKNESLCLLAKQFYPEAQWLQSGEENYGPCHARPTRKMKALNRNLAQLESAHSTGVHVYLVQIWVFSAATNVYTVPTMWMALGILKEVFTRLMRGGKAGLAEGVT